MFRKTIIIAEAGVNHNGSLDLARKLVDIAVEAGADYVKFQTFKAEKIASKLAGKADYQLQNGHAVEGQVEMLKRLELSEASHFELLQYCQQKNIHFLSTAFDLDSIDFLKKIGIRLGKVPSGEITNLPYLRKMAQSFEELVVSTGMTETHEISAALEVFRTQGLASEKITLLHCNTEYPTPFEDVNLRAMETMAKTWNMPVGYSDHTPGIEVPIAAVAMGAVLIEKHFTIDRDMEGPDHRASLSPRELIDMVAAIRNIEKALGSFTKKPSPSEIKNKAVARKSIVAAERILKGEKFTEENLTVKRPGTGISPMLWDDLIDRTAKKDFDEDELIEL